LRRKPRFSVTMDPQILAKLDLESGPRKRSAMVEVAVDALLQVLHNVRRTKELFDIEPKPREDQPVK
jgi:hypothetical protein